MTKEVHNAKLVMSLCGRDLEELVIIVLFTRQPLVYKKMSSFKLPKQTLISHEVRFVNLFQRVAY